MNAHRRTDVHARYPADRVWEISDRGAGLELTALATLTLRCAEQCEQGITACANEIQQAQGQSSLSSEPSGKLALRRDGAKAAMSSINIARLDGNRRNRAAKPSLCLKEISPTGEAHVALVSACSRDQGGEQHMPQSEK